MAWEDRSGRIRRDIPRLLTDQVADDLARDIRAGVLRPGSRLPSEPELAEIYGVGRITVRRALARLERDGLVIVLRGRGTYVSLDPPADGEAPPAPGGAGGA